MKSYTFLIPVAIAAAALAGNNAKANPNGEIQNTATRGTNTSSAADDVFTQKYAVGNEEHALLLRLSDEGILYAQHDSHSSHSSHSSHTSHTSHVSSS